MDSRRRRGIATLQTAFAVLLLASVPAAAQEAGLPQREVFELLRLGSDLEQLAPNVLARLDEQKQNLPAELFPELRAATQEAFGAAAVLANYSKQLENNLSPEDAAGCLEFLRGPVARKLALLESQASGPEAEAQAKAHVDGLKKDATTSARKALLEREVDRSDAVEAYVRRSQCITAALNRSLARVLPPERRPSQAQIDRQLALLDKQMRPTFRANLIALLLYAYRSVPDEEIRQSVEFYESPPGQALRRALRLSGKATFEAATQAMVKAFEKRLSAPPKPDTDW